MNAQSNHTLNNFYSLTALFFLVCMLWLVSGCASQSIVTVEPTIIVPTGTTTSEPTSSATQSPTFTPTPSPTPSETKPSPTSASITRLDSIFDAGLVDDNQGWVISARRLLWTSDGGDSWLDITPAHQGDLIITNVFFLDADHGWVVMIPPPEVEQVSIEILVFHSQDGGETWEQNSWEADLPFGMYSGITDLGFIDVQNGWLVVNQTASMNASAADLYYTPDGGLTWQTSKLPFNGPVHFITTELGFTIGSCCTGAPRQLFRSEDGGVTWEQQAFVSNPVDDGFDYHDYQLPEFINQVEGLLAVTHRDVFFEAVDVGIYQTNDNGSSWHLKTTFSPSEIIGPGPGSAVQVQFLGSITWIVAVGNSVYVTEDGGASWEKFEQVQLPGWHYKLMFVNERMGWSLVFKDYCGDDCLILYQTMDGGLTWTALGDDQ
jgi:photosystem II stability/assembly factor-like uncharacterized protein